MPANVDADSDLLALGLLPSHLKTVSAEIRAVFGVDLTPQQLLRCRNARQVTSLMAVRAAYIPSFRVARRARQRK